jgi:hypothetical protein
MRTLAGCVLLLGLTGCHFGTHEGMWKHTSRDAERFADPTESEHSAVPMPGAVITPAPEDSHFSPPAPPPESDDISANPQADTGTRGWFSVRRSDIKTASKSVSKKKSGRAAKTTTSQDDAVQHLITRLEQAKREKAHQEYKHSDESFKLSQQRLELEARVAVLQEQLRQQQEQLRQQSALQQVTHQQQVAPMRPTTTTAGAMPIITTGTPSPSMTGSQTFGSANVGSGISPCTPPAPAWNSPAPAWTSPAPAWNSPAIPAQSSVETWPYSPQGR